MTIDQSTLEVEAQFRWSATGLDVALNVGAWLCEFIRLDGETAAWAGQRDPDYFADIDDCRTDRDNDTKFNVPPSW